MTLRTLATSMTLNQRLGAFALALGAIAIFAQPGAGARVTVDARELASITQRGVDHVAPRDLADWLVTGRSDFRLVDLRTEKEFAEYHIPGAENVPVDALVASDLARNEQIVLYSGDGVHAAQAWFLLKAKGYRAVYTLAGGLDAWDDEVLFPTLAENPTPFQAQRNDRFAALARHFGGQPRTGSSTALGSAAPARMPAIEAPVAALSGAAPEKKKKKEGC